VKILLTIKGGNDEMIKPSISLQDLRRKIYRKAKAEKTWRFWGLYVHVCDKPHPARVGELLSDWTLQPVFWLYQGLGGEEGSATSHAGQETQRIRLEQMEEGLVLCTLGLFNDYRVRYDRA